MPDTASGAGVEAPKCPFIPPYPVPLKDKAGLLRRFWTGWNSWIHTLFERSYTMKMGGVSLPRLKLYVVNDLAIVARVLDDPQREYPKHPMLMDLLGPLIGDSVFSANGKAWADQRQMVNPAFAHTNLARVFPMMDSAAQDLIAIMRADDLSRPVDIDPLMTHVTADIIFRTIFSVTLSRSESARIYAAFNRYQAHAQRSTTLAIHGLPRLGFARRARKAAAEIHGVFTAIMRARYDARQAGNRPEHSDILEALMDARHAESGEPFTFQELVNQTSVIFLAGHETSASALAWALYLLSENAELQEQLHTQIETETSGGPLEFQHIRRLDGLRNLFKETLRLYPPVGFLPRSVAKPETMRGKHLQPEDLLVIAPWLIHRNSDNWTCPHSFDPDRFSRPEDAEAVRNAWLPFGRGARLCIGAGFAQQEALIILAHVIRAFRLTHPDGPRPELVSRLTLRPRRGVPLILTPRG
jgi:cytochrome P450